jgi:hypothetical protein
LRQAIDQYHNLEQRLADHKDQLTKEISATIEQQNKDLLEKSKKVSIAIYKMNEIEPVIKKIESTLIKFE